MSARRRARLGVAALLVVVATAIAAPASPAQAADVTIAMSRSSVATRLGSHFRFTSTVANAGRRALASPVLNLNVVSLDPGVYVDPEDWSAQRTRYVGRLGAGRRLTTSWSVTAVTSGHVKLYVTALPAANRRSPGRPVVGPALDVRVAGRTTLNAGGVLPVAIGVPALLGLAALAVRSRRRS